MSKMRGRKIVGVAFWRGTRPLRRASAVPGMSAEKERDFTSFSPVRSIHKRSPLLAGLGAASRDSFVLGLIEHARSRFSPRSPVRYRSLNHTSERASDRFLRLSFSESVSRHVFSIVSDGPPAA